jgi:hypothetical protein
VLQPWEARRGMVWLGQVAIHFAGPSDVSIVFSCVPARILRI